MRKMRNVVVMDSKGPVQRAPRCAQGRHDSESRREGEQWDNSDWIDVYYKLTTSKNRRADRLRPVASITKREAGDRHFRCEQTSV